MLARLIAFLLGVGVWDEIDLPRGHVAGELLPPATMCGVVLR
jgi:hypothetical protein